MYISTDFDIGENVRIKGGKYKDSIAEIIGISLSKQGDDDGNAQVVYSIKVTTSDKISFINRTAEHLKQTNLARKSPCVSCYNLTEPVHKGMCFQCFTHYYEKVEDDLYITRQLIEEKKRYIFSSSETIKFKEDILSELQTLLQTAKEYEKNLSNAMFAKKTYESKY